MAQALGDRNTLDRQREFVNQSARARFGKAQLTPLQQQSSRAPEEQPNGRPVLDEAAYVKALRRELSKTEPVGDENLTGLAQARANAIADSLKQVPGVDPKRITRGGIVKTKADSGGTIPLTLDAASVTGQD